MKQVFFNQEAREKFKKGIDIVADAVGSTLGAGGKGVIISKGYGHFPFTTKDGVTVANDIFLEDEVENTGAMFIREACSKTLLLAGDGTTTTAVLAQNILQNGLVATNDGANAQEIRSGIEKAVDCVTEQLKAIAAPVNDNEMIKSIATVSANNDIELGGLIAELYSKIGNDVKIEIEKSPTFKTYTKTKDGAEISAGYVNEGFVTDRVKKEYVCENPYILVLDYEVKNMKQVEPFFQNLLNREVNLTTQGVVIVANGFEGEFYNTMLVNKMRYNFKVCLVQSPSAYQKEFLKDISTLTGATLICDEVGMKIENASFEHLGSCEKIIVTKYPTVIVGGAGTKESVDFLKASIKTDIDNTENPEVKNILEKRLARLSGSIGVICVGGFTNTEMEEKIARVDDAVRATKSAVEEGVVAGGGVALIRCMKKLDALETNGDEIVGVELIKNACFSPLIKMLENAGELNSLDKEISEAKRKRGEAHKEYSKLMIADKPITDEEINNKLISFDNEIKSAILNKINCNIPVFNNVVSSTGNTGYNIKTKTMEDLVKSGVIDPAKVVRCALQSASSVAVQVITSDVLLVEMKPKD